MPELQNPLSIKLGKSIPERSKSLCLVESQDAKPMIVRNFDTFALSQNERFRLTSLRLFLSDKTISEKTFLLCNFQIFFL